MNISIKKTVNCAILLLLIFTLFSVVVRAVEIPTTVRINVDPNVTAVTLTDTDGGQILPLITDLTNLSCTGTVQDLDGFADIVSVNATYFGPSSTHTSAPSTGTKYVNSSCVLFGGVGNTTNFRCEVYGHHHIEPGNWRCNVTARDTYNRTGFLLDNETVQIFRSIQVPLTALDFGFYALGQNSTTVDTNFTVNNTGNVYFNISLDAYSQTGVPSDTRAMSCLSGNISVGNLRWSLLPNQDVTSQKTALTNAATGTANNLTPTAFGNTAYTQDTVYLGIIIPSSGAYGVCTGYLDVTAIGSP